MPTYEQLDVGKCPLCGDRRWLYRTIETVVVACGPCTTKLAHTRIPDGGVTHETDTEKLLRELLH